jgi:methionyl-tRNA formyltransferase
MRTVFFCGHKSRYGLAHLKPILESGFQIVAVVLATDKRWECFREQLAGKSYYNFRDRNLTLSFKSFLKQALPAKAIRLIRKDYQEVAVVKTDVVFNLKVPVIYTFDVNEPTFLEKLKVIKPELIMSAAYPQIFSEELIKIPSSGAVNFHPSLLPKFRGAHPHFWAIAKGEKVSGLTAHYMTVTIDDGDIIAQVDFPIWQYTYSEFYNKIVEEVPAIIKMVELFLIEKKGRARPQNDEDASYFREPREIHKRIFWNIHLAEEIKNLIRTEQAFCYFRSAKVGCLNASITRTNRNLTNDVNVEPGTIVDLKNDCIVIKAIDGCINIESIIDCGKQMTSMEWIMRRKINIGEKID